MVEKQPTQDESPIIPVKLRPGYTFKHPETGVALQRSLPDKQTGKTKVLAINKGGGQQVLPGPFFLLSENALKGQMQKFEHPSEAELEKIKKASTTEVKIKVAPKPRPMTALSLPKDAPAPENKMVTGSPEKKSGGKKGPAKKTGKGKGASKKTS